MKQTDALALLGLIIAIPLLVFTVKNNLWAEPLPPEKRIPFTVVKEVNYAEGESWFADRGLGESEN